MKIDEIIQRYEESLMAYNRAAGLIDKGRLDEAEELLKKAFSRYPREILMDEDTELDAGVRESYETLFSNISDKLDIISSIKSGPKLDTHSILTLKDLVERNVTRKKPEPAETGYPQAGSGPEIEEYFPEPEEVISGARAAQEPEEQDAEFEKVWSDDEKEPAEEQPELVVQEEQEESLELEENFREAVTEEIEETTTLYNGKDEKPEEEPSSEVTGAADIIEAEAEVDRAIESALTIDEESPLPEDMEPAADVPEESAPEEEPTAPEQPPAPEKTENGDSSIAKDIAESLQSPPEDITDEIFEAGAPGDEDAPVQPAEAETAAEPAGDDSLAVAQEEMLPGDEVITTPEEESTSDMQQKKEKKPGPLKKLFSGISAIFSGSKKKTDVEEPLEISEEGPAIEPEKAEAPQAAETEPQAPQPEPEQPEDQPQEQAPPEKRPSEEDESEALISEEEFKRHGKSDHKQTLMERTRINVSGIFSTIFIILLFITGGTYLGYQIYLEMTGGLNMLYQKGGSVLAAEKPELDRATTLAFQYKALLAGSDSEKNRAAAFMVASWGNYLRVHNSNPVDAILLMKIFKREGLKSATLDEELALSYIHKCADDIKQNRVQDANDAFTAATDLLKEGSVPAARARTYKRQLARLGYLLAAEVATESLARKDAASAHAALARMRSLSDLLGEKEQKNIRNIAAATANRLLQEARDALKKGDAALAAEKAAQALELNPEMNAAASLLKLAQARIK